MSKNPLNFLNSNLLKDGIEYIGGIIGQEREVFYERLFEPGEYLIFVEIDWSLNKESSLFENDKTYSFVLSTYSLNEIEVSQVNNEMFPDILEKIYISCAKMNNSVTDFSVEGAPNCLK
jgi:hypothetical protein